MDGYNSSNPDSSDNPDSYNNPVSNLEKRVKTIKRCPFCNSSNIYKRVRSILDQPNIKQYRCHKCKKEFNTPIKGEKDK